MSTTAVSSTPAGAARAVVRTVQILLCGETIIVDNVPFSLELAPGELDQVERKLAGIARQLLLSTRSHGVELPDAEVDAFLERVRELGASFAHALPPGLVERIGALEAERPLRLQFTTPPEYAGPWSIIYAGDPIEPVDQEQFWGFRYPGGHSFIGRGFALRSTIELGDGVLLGRRLTPADQDFAGGSLREMLQGVGRSSLLLEEALAEDSASDPKWAMARLFSADDFRYGIVHLDLALAPEDREPGELTLTIGGQETSLSGLLRGPDNLFTNAPLLFLNVRDNRSRGSAGLTALNLPQRGLSLGAGAVVVPAVPLPGEFAAAFAREFYKRLLAPGRPSSHPADVLNECIRHFLDGYNNPLGLLYRYYGQADLLFLRGEEKGPVGEDRARKDEGERKLGDG